MNLSFRTRLLLSYLLIILMAAGIVYFVSLAQIRVTESNDINESLTNDTNAIRDEIKNLYLETSQEWLCGEIDEFSPDQMETLEDWFHEEMEGAPFNCEELPFGSCFILGEELGINDEIELENGEIDTEFFCEQRTALLESEPFERERNQLLDELSTEWSHIILWNIDHEFVDHSVGEGPGFELSTLDFEDTSEVERIREPIEFGETGEEFIYVGRVVQLEVIPILYVAVGYAAGEIEFDAQIQALRISLITAVVGIVLLSALGFRMANTLSRPLTELRNSAQAMAAGQLDTRADTSAPPEIRELAEDFNQMASAVEAMVAEQRAFANNAAHELRTPLTAVRIRTEALLEDEPDEQTQQAYISEIHDEIKRLSRLVEDLRVLSRADAHNMEVGHEEVNLVNLIRALQREFDKQIQEKELTITLDTSEDPFIVKAAATHMRTALRNVLENAIKYNTAGGDISISLKNVERDQQSFHQLSMIDSGIGIPAAELPNLTKRFYRVDKAHNRDIPGSGLGLSLVHSIVGLYGGRLEIVSDGVGQGSQVTILLPKGVGS